MLTSRELSQLWRDHAAALLLLARSRCGNSATNIAEDCVQEAFIRLAAKEPVPSDPAAWLATVVRNIAIDALRSQQRRSRREASVVAGRPAWLEPVDTSALSSPSSDEIEWALQQLDDDTRDVVVAHVWNRMTFQQIADAFGLSRATAHRMYTAGIERLKHLMLNMQKTP